MSGTDLKEMFVLLREKFHSVLRFLKTLITDKYATKMGYIFFRTRLHFHKNLATN